MCLREQEWKGQQGDGEEKVHADYPQAVVQTKIRTTRMRKRTAIKYSYPCVMCAATKNPTSDPKMGQKAGRRN